MNATALAQQPRFVRRTRLGPNEYRKNFRQLDCDVIDAITSREADGVTPLMSKIYLKLVSAPPEFWEREGVLYFAAGEDGERTVKASKVLYGLLGVASATAHKALAWMHERGIIGYCAGRNGVGIRIFINRATGPIGVRVPESRGQKILAFSRGSNGGGRGSTYEPPFNDSFAVGEVLEKKSTPRAPKSGAGEVAAEGTEHGQLPTMSGCRPRAMETSGGGGARSAAQTGAPVEEIVRALRLELEPSIQSAARLAAAREHERTREWLESRGLPKAARVAQREAFDMLRRHGLINRGAGNSTARASVGRSEFAPEAPHPLTCEEVEELAQACVAMLEVKGQPVEVTLSEMSAGRGGFLLPDDEAKVRELAEALLVKGGARAPGEESSP